MFKIVVKTFFNFENWRSLKSVVLTAIGFIIAVAMAFIVFQPTNVFFLMPSYDKAYAADLDNYDGKVLVYIVDSGVDGNAGGLQGYTAKGYDAVEDEQGGNHDCSGHGSSVASVVAGLTKSDDVTIVPVKTGGCEKMHDPVAIVRGINWIIENHPEGAPVGVINISLGYVDIIPFLDGLQNAVQSALDAGFVVVTSAGNESVTAGEEEDGVVAEETFVEDACRAVPANVPDVITVGSAVVTGKNKNKVVRSVFSNSGPCIDLFAPGENVSVVKRTSNGDWAFVNGQGTSYASPYVAGIIANKLAVERTLNRAQLEEYVKSKAADGVMRSTLELPIEPSNPVKPELSTPNMFIKLETKNNGFKQFYTPEENR